MFLLSLIAAAAAEEPCPAFFDPQFEAAVAERCAGEWMAAQAKIDWIEASADRSSDADQLAFREGRDQSKVEYRRAHTVYVDCLERRAKERAAADGVRPSAATAVFADCAREQASLDRASAALPEDAKSAVDMRGAPQNYLWPRVYQLMLSMDLRSKLGAARR